MPIKHYKTSSNNQQIYGAADQEMFIKEFENVSRKHIFSVKDIEDSVNSIKDILEDMNVDWEKRIESLRTFRSILIDMFDVNTIITSLKILEVAFQTSLKDLRSKVVREACITIAYTSVRLENKCEKFIEALLQVLISLIQNSTKIMSSSAVVAIRFCIQHTHSSKFIPIIHNNFSSKSKEIRRSTCEFLNQLLKTWPTSILEKHLTLLLEDIKKGLNDADPEVRSYSRKAFWLFASYFKQHADKLMKSLDPSKRRMLENEQMADISNNSIGHCVVDAANKNKSGIPRNSCARSNFRSVFKPLPKSLNSPIEAGNVIISPLRTTSSIDIGAARSAVLRSKAKNEITALLNKNKLNTDKNINILKLNNESKDKLINVNILEISKNSPHSIISNQTDYSKINNDLSTSENRGRTPLRISQSQPNSRSTSPSLKLSFLTNLCADNNYTPVERNTIFKFRSSTRRRSGIPIANHYSNKNNSSCVYSNEKRVSNSKLKYSGGRKSLIERKLNSSYNDLDINSFLKKFNSDYQSDESEVSSLCSEKSFNSLSEKSLENINDILKNLTCQNWPTKKEGLISLQNYLTHSQESFHENELKIITDIFAKMLLDPNTKTLALFLNVLNSLILRYKDRLHNWLYVLLTRLFLKIGSDILSSVQKRILKTLNIVCESFPNSLQFNVLVRFLSDQAQIPVNKVKITVLQYFHDLILQMDPCEWECQNNHEFQLCLMKIISWTSDQKSSQLRSISQEVIYDLFNLKTPEFCSVVNQLPKAYLDAAYKIIENERKSVQENSFYNDSLHKKMMKSIDKTMFLNDDDDLSQEDVYNSLLKTTEEINKFTSDSKDEFSFNHKTKQSSNQESISLVKDKKTNNSMDSGISQIDGNSINKTAPSNCNSSKIFSDKKSNSSNNANEIIDQCDLATNNSDDSIPSITINSYSATEYSSVKDNIDESRDVKLSTDEYCQNKDKNKTNIKEKVYYETNNNSSFDNKNLILSDYKQNIRNEELNCIFNKINFKNKTDDVKEAFKNLNYLISDYVNYSLWPSNFECTLKFLLTCLDNNDLFIKELSTNSICELMIYHINEFPKYYTLVMDKLLSLNKENSKDFQNSIDNFYDLSSQAFPIDICIDYLLNLIDCSKLPINQNSIKLLTKIIEKSDEEILNILVPKIMPTLVKAYDNPDSSVRKCSVFCLVELFNKVGLTIKPYLLSLNSSKIKLLKLYIDRSKKKHPTSPLLKN